MKITTLTQGAAQAGIYGKYMIPNVAAIAIMVEQSTNYNSNAQSFVLYHDGPAGQPLAASMRNTTGASDFRLQWFGSATTGSTHQFTTLFDRSIVGSGEEACWLDGSPLVPVATSGTAEQTGVFSAYDVYIGARGGASLFAAMWMNTLVFYNADTTSIRTSIETLVA